MTKKVHFLLLIVLCMSVSLVSCRKTMLPGMGVPEEEVETPQPTETDPPTLTPITTTVTPNINGYYAALPARYHETTHKYPVIVFFHGGGQYGNGSTDLYKVLQDGIPKLIDEKTFPVSFSVNERKYSFIVVAPQFVNRSSNNDVTALMKYVKANFRVDLQRVYLAGFSLGARFLSDYAAIQPNEIAAVVSMAGMVQIDENLNTKAKSMADAKLPIWHFHNRDDGAWDYSESESYIGAINSFNPTIAPRFTTFEVGTARLHHDCWTKGSDPEYRENGKNIYEWMLSYKR